MSTNFRSEMRDAFEREARRHPTPPGLRQVTIRSAIGAARQMEAPSGLVRAGLRLGALLLVIVVSLAIVGVFIVTRQASVQTVPARPRAVPTSQAGTGYTKPTSPIPVKMVDRNNGWAGGALRTTDGGAHWQDVSPPSLPNRQGNAPEFYLDSNHAWQGQTFADHVIIFRTVDGGRTWQQGAPVSVKLSVVIPSPWVRPPGDTIGSQLYFIDDQRGWLETGSSLQNGFAYRPDPAAQGLFRTVDGGVHWTLQSTGPGAAASGCFFGGGMTFISNARGWIGFSCPPAFGPSQSKLLTTSDGGITWQVQQLATDSRCPCNLDNTPLFFDQQHGFVQGSASDKTPLLLATTDGGSTWSARMVPGEGRRGMRLSFADATAGWAIVQVAKHGAIGPSPACSSGYAYLATPSECFPPPEMYRTVDGGQTWALIQTDLFSPDGEVYVLLFVDAHNGFALRALASTQNLQSGLLRTNDGGRTWKPIATAILGR